MAKLTIAQKNMVDLIISGHSLEEAHGLAYPKSLSWTKRVRSNNATKLLKKPVVRDYYEQQKKEVDEKKTQLAQEKALWSFEQSVGALKFVVSAAIEDAKYVKSLRDSGESKERIMNGQTSSSIIHAITELNKMLGIDKQSYESSDGSPVCFINDYMEEFDD